MRNKELPKHITLSAITSGIKCDLCHKEMPLTAHLGDGLEDDLRVAISDFISAHRNCTQTIKIILNKTELHWIGKVTDSPEKFVLDAIETAIKNIPIS